MRTQYYTPDGGKLPVALKKWKKIMKSFARNWDYVFYETGDEKVLWLSLDNRRVFEAEGEGYMLQKTHVTYCLRYASDFTEEELKGLKDEKDI